MYTNVKRSQWGTNNHFNGSYSFHSMNTDKEGKANSQLAKPLTNSSGKNVSIICKSKNIMKSQRKKIEFYNLNLDFAVCW